jgi:hypothetical protein
VRIADATVCRLTIDQVWQLVSYVRSLSSARSGGRRRWSGAWCAS